MRQGLEAKELSVSYEEKLVIHNINMEIPKGKITSIIGPNGCGKSTILKTMGRILRPSGGRVCLEGFDIREIPSKEIAKKISILPQSPQAPQGLLVGDLVAYGRYPYKKRFGTLTEEDKSIVGWAMDAAGIREFELMPVEQMSGGQRQRVWIAMLLAQQADILLLDEPTTYLDMSHQLELLELLHHLNHKEGCTVVMVLHDLNLASRFSDYMVAVHSGEIICQGKPEDVMRKDVLRNVFRINAKIISEPETGKPICFTYSLEDDKYTEG